MYLYILLSTILLSRTIYWLGGSSVPGARCPELVRHAIVGKWRDPIPHKQEPDAKSNPHQPTDSFFVRQCAHALKGKKIVKKKSFY
ncbi:hypothetical protein F4809DRAFT_226176 [Biscogniauxia mediterranea]|nr:hypothetical protein F4809DRAFT_226176 [Biscogniauxia mediterranea]